MGRDRDTIEITTWADHSWAGRCQRAPDLPNSRKEIVVASHLPSMAQSPWNRSKRRLRVRSDSADTFVCVDVLGAGRGRMAKGIS